MFCGVFDQYGAAAGGTGSSSSSAPTSATRTLREPTPSRIESLVDQIANKRLMDGQFDECDLTLGELHKVTDSISKTLASIYHGRVQYPGEEKGEKPAKPSDEPAQSRGKSA